MPETSLCMDAPEKQTTAGTPETEKPHRPKGILPAPIRTLREILRDTGHQIMEAELPLVASSLAYTTLLSIVPALAVSFSVFQAFGGMDKLYALVEPLILENLAQSASSEATAFLRRFVNNAHAGAVGASGFLALLITALAMLNSIEKAINRVWKTRVHRHWFVRLSLYWLLISLGPVILGVFAGFAASFMKAADAKDSGIAWIRQIIPSGTSLFLLVTVSSYLLYRFVPNRKVHWAPALTGAMTTGIGWNVARFGYNLYVRKFVSFNRIYGSLAAIPVLLLWIYIIWLIVLTGAALTAALQHRLDRTRIGA